MSKRKMMEDEDDNVLIKTPKLSMSQNILNITNVSNLNKGEYILISDSKLMLKMSLSILENNNIKFIRPQCQRTLDAFVVNERYHYNLKKDVNDMDFGVLKGAINKNDGSDPTNLYIMDGQHRLSVLEKLYYDNEIDPFFILDIKIVSDKKEMENYFTYINTARIVDTDTCYFDKNEKKIVEDLTSLFIHSNLVQSSGKRVTNRPYLNQDIIGHIFKKLSPVNTFEEIEVKLQKLNSDIEKQPDDIKYDKLKNYTKIYNDIKTKFNNNYLGLLRPDNKLWLNIFPIIQCSK